MKTSKTLSLKNEFSFTFNGEREEEHFPFFTLTWRRKQLLVTPSDRTQNLYFPLSETQKKLVNCLEHSWVQLVRLDSNLGEENLNLWADACKKAKKKVFLWIPSLRMQSQKKNLLSWWIKRLFDMIATTLLLLLLSPVILCLMLFLLQASPGTIFSRQWYIGERGKLFQAVMFQTHIVKVDNYSYQTIHHHKNQNERENGSPYHLLGYWMKKYGLDKIPQLFNVLRGQMSLIGLSPWSLHEIDKLSVEQRQRLNALPGIVNIYSYSKEGFFQEIDLDLGIQHELDYLRNWSLIRELKLILMIFVKKLKAIINKFPEQ